MTQCHPQIEKNSFKNNINHELDQSMIEGYISLPILELIFNIFSWVYMENDQEKAFKEDTKIRFFLRAFDLSVFKGPSIIYSTVLFYNVLNKIINIRFLEKGRVKKAGVKDNRFLSKKDFYNKELFLEYSKYNNDINKDFLIFNTLFKPKNDKQNIKLNNYGDITNLSNITDLIRPDFKYKLAIKNLNVKKESIIRDKRETLYILQDATFSMKQYLDKLYVLKAFILSEAFKNNFDVEWLYVTNDIKDRVLYIKENVQSFEKDFKAYSTQMDTTKILTRNEFINKQVVLITDGTDSFNFVFNTKTKKINIITFIENKAIKNKILKYGKYFRF